MKKLVNNDNLKELSNYENNFFDLILTDIPYGLTSINALDLIKNNSNNQKGFMNKAWDCLPTIEALKEFNRALKDGGWFITTFIPRQDLQTILYYRLLEADFDISFSPIYHTFANGFPKGNNISKKLDKRATTVPTTPEAKYCDGLYGEFQPKPAVEIIVIAQKKYKSKSQIDHALQWYTERKELLEKGIKEEDLSLHTKLASGGTWIDEGRIPTQDLKETERKKDRTGSVYGKDSRIFPYQPLEQGRYPANLLVSDNCLDVGRETKGQGRKIKEGEKINKSNIPILNSQFRAKSDIIDKGDLSRYFSKDAWVKKHLPEFYKLSSKSLQLEEDAEKIYPFLNVSKASVEEKNLGLDEFESKQIEIIGQLAKIRTSPLKQNIHPTSKNITLFAYLLKLFSKENDVVLDPYCGSGTTLIACELLNRNYLGIELEEEYYNIAKARIEYWKNQKESFDNLKEEFFITQSIQEELF